MQYAWPWAFGPPSAPTITSAKPSPFTSPAVATKIPYIAPARSLSTLQAGIVESPAAEPRYRYARPSSTSGSSNDGAPTITSENPYPFTSPAVATDLP